MFGDLRRIRDTATLLLLPAVLGLTPSIRTCALDRAHLDPASIVRCLILGTPDAGATFRTVDVTAPARSAACAEGTCPAARRDASCGEHSGSCMARGYATSGCAASPVASPARPRPSHAPVYCLGDPTGGRALRSDVPRIVDPGPLDGLAAFAAAVADDPAPARAAWPEITARAPPHRPAARPPVRAPPATS